MSIQSGITQLKKGVSNWFLAVIFMVAMGWSFVYLTANVSGESMFPTLKDEQTLLIRHRLLLETHLKQGDIISFRPRSYGTNVVKRVIGLAGDVIEIKQNEVYRNGEKLDEPYLFTTDWNLDGQEDLKVVVPEGKLFVLGDNRTESVDSRHYEIGWVDEKDEVIGRILIAF